MDLLGGVEGRVMMGKRRGGGKGEEERELSRKEIKEALKKMKEGKAMGIDGILGEAWKYGGEELEKWCWSFYNEV
jgi:hypothetical protein